MARSIWKGAITFGLVSIPVGLFPTQNILDHDRYSFLIMGRLDQAE